MFNWATSIGKILAVRADAERERHRRVQLERLQISYFCEGVVLTAMQRLGGELERHGRHVEIRRNGNILSMFVLYQGRVEFSFSAAASRRRRTRKQPGRHRDAAGYAHSVDRVYSLHEARRLGAENVCNDIVARYRRHVHV